MITPLTFILAQYGVLEFHLLAMQISEQAEQTTHEVAKTVDHWPDATVQMQLVILLTTIAGFVYNVIMARRKEKVDERKRQWDLEDRAAARAETTTRVRRLSKGIREVKASTVNLESKLDENTEISKQAFDRANNFNDKLEQTLRVFREDPDVSGVEVTQSTQIRAIPTEGSDAGPSDAATRHSE